MKPNIEISESNLKEVATLLNTLLADEFVLYTKTRNAHWNAHGPGFMELHKLFESQYEALDDIIDEVAERVRTLGHFTVASLKDYLKLTHFTEEDDDFTNQSKSIRTLLDGHETLARVLRNDITATDQKFKDAGTTDFLTGILKHHEKAAWMLRSYLS